MQKAKGMLIFFFKWHQRTHCVLIFFFQYTPLIAPPGGIVSYTPLVTHHFSPSNDYGLSESPLA